MAQLLCVEIYMYITHAFVQSRPVMHIDVCANCFHSIHAHEHMCECASA